MADSWCLSRWLYIHCRQCSFAPELHFQIGSSIYTRLGGAWLSVNGPPSAYTRPRLVTVPSPKYLKKTFARQRQVARRNLVDAEYIGDVDGRRIFEASSLLTASPTDSDARRAAGSGGAPGPHYEEATRTIPEMITVRAGNHAGFPAEQSWSPMRLAFDVRDMRSAY